MIATAGVESTYDPGARGDGGTSYGLFQHHVGGAGGGSHASAQRYLDPVTSITERAKWFKKMNIVDGSGAARLQRPANPGEYAGKVNRALGGAQPDLNAPVTTSGGSSADTSTVSSIGSAAPVESFTSRDALFSMAFKDNPTMMALYKAKQGARDRNAAAAAAEAAASAATPEPSAGSGGGATTTPTGSQAPAVPSGPLPSLSQMPRKPGEPAWKYLQRLGTGLFGLRNDPGNSQTTGGRHATHSHHYRGAAIDFGNARNSESQLAKWHRFIDQNRKALGVVELLNEGDHRHVAIRK
jgi:hypothetical protein